MPSKEQKGRDSELKVKMKKSVHKRHNERMSSLKEELKLANVPDSEIQQIVTIKERRDSEERKIDRDIELMRRAQEKGR